MVRIKNFFKSAGRYLKSILPAFLFFTTLLFSFSVPVFATSGGLVTVKPGSPSLNTSVARWIIEYSMELGDNINDDFMVLQKGALYWFFDVLVNDTYGASTSTFTVMGQSYSVTPHSVRAVSDGKNLDKFDDDYFHTYFDCIRRYCLSNLSEQTDPSCTTFVSNYFYNLMERKPNYLSRFPCSFPDIFFYASDPGSNYISDSMGMLPSNESNVKKYFDYLYADYLKSNGLSGVSVGYDNISDIDNYTKLPIISGDTFNEIIPTLNKQYYPKNASGKMSYRTDERFHNHFNHKLSGYTYRFAELYSSKFGFAPVGGGNDMYIVLFNRLGNDMYYSKYQYHFFVTSEDVWCDDRDEIDHTSYSIGVEYWDMVDGSREDSKTHNFSFKSDTLTCFMLNFTTSFDNTSLMLDAYSSFQHFLDYSLDGAASVDIPGYNMLYSSDLSQSIYFNSDHWLGYPTIDEHDSSCSYAGNCDGGYVASVTPLSVLYNIDTTRIPENYYITVSGDTIYDYSITNPETGQKDTIQNFITNNYTFNNGDTNIDTGDHNTSIGGSCSGNGGGGGDVNVNVTVNNNIGGGGGGSYDMPDTSFFDDYLDDALEESTGIRKFIMDFFNSVPGQITKLICTGLVLAILCRLIGR